MVGSFRREMSSSCYWQAFNCNNNYIITIIIIIITIIKINKNNNSGLQKKETITNMYTIRRLISI